MEIRTSTGELPRVRVAVATILGLALAVPPAVIAAEEDKELAEVQVTGTRILVPENYVSSNPITTITGEDLRRLGMVNVAGAITTLVPQNISQYQPSMSGNLMGTQSSFFIGQTIANLRGLDPAFGSRTLTMIDGRRVVSTSNQADVVDLNIIPSNLLQRMDVVTGGASATYGSGAMTGVVNLVLNKRLQGVNLDMDYGVFDEGDGGSWHMALSAGTSLFGGRGHIIAAGEWQNQTAILNCAAARGWCGESRGLLVNSENTRLPPGTAFTPLAGYENLPFRFQVTNLRYGQFNPAGSIILQNQPGAQTAWRFTDSGTEVEEYALGFRGGAGPGQVVNGDGPPATWGTTLMPESERKTAFSHFEFDFTESTTGYAEASFAKTEGVNVQFPTQLNACVRFDQPGVPAEAGASFTTGDLIPVWPGFGTAGPPPDSIWNNPQFIEFLGGPNWWQGTDAVTFVPDALGPGQPAYQINADFEADEVPAQLPGMGDGQNAFLNTLSDEALAVLRSQFNNQPITNQGANSLLWGVPTATGIVDCGGMATLYKNWNPQMQQRTEQDSRTIRAVVGVKGRWGETWNWDAYYQYGRTDSESRQYSAMTNYRYAFALDSVMDQNGNRVCRVTRDGVPTTTMAGEPFSDPAGLAQLAEGCVPLNPFGYQYSNPAMATQQQAALAYAFRNLISTGQNRLDVLAINTSGKVLDGWAGPITTAVGMEFRRDQVDNEGSEGLPIERLDFPFPWADKFGGRTDVFEQYLELNLPLVSDARFLRSWSINGAVRHAHYENKGGEGTTGASGSQDIVNWKFSTDLAPFDWVRFRLTRSRDLRAAGYRELFYNSPGAPDSTTGTNYWRDFNPFDTSLRTDRLTTNSIGNPNLNPEISDTLTVGLVLTPGGWAQGMRFSADYIDTKVRDGLAGAFSSPIQACWTASGNVDPVIDPETGQISNPDEWGNGAFDATNPYCQMIHFGDPLPGSSNPYSNILSYDTTFQNAEPFRTRGVDFSWDYLFPASKLPGTLPGNLSLTVRGTRAIEASGWVSEFLRDFLPDPSDPTVDFVGQLGTGLGFIPGIQPTPTWSGNIIGTYLLGPAMVSLSARYVGSAKIDKTYYSDGPGQPFWQDEDGNFVVGSIDNNSVPSYWNVSFNASYNFRVPGTKQFETFVSINNLFDKDPPFAGGFLSGASPQFHDTFGRAFRGGVRVQF